MRHEWVVRFDYGKIRPVGAAAEDRADRTDEVITAVAGPDMLVLRGAAAAARPATATTSTSSTSRRARS